jgi:hypothetical protein
MIKLLRADDFLNAFAEHRILYASGRYGSGKSSLGVALAWDFGRRRMVDHCISSMPIAFGEPARNVAGDAFVLLDEAGVFYDARRFADRKQNEFRTGAVAYLRKINSYLYISSRVVPDASFRALTVQRALAIINGRIEVYKWALQDAAVDISGWFLLLDRAWTWRMRLYDHRYIPAGAIHIEEWFKKVTAVPDHGDPNEPPEAISERSTDPLARLLSHLPAPEEPNRAAAPVHHPAPAEAPANLGGLVYPANPSVGGPSLF